MCVGDPAKIADGAGYVVSDRVIGIVHGSGTSELAGITGTLAITPDHQFVLDYELKAEG